jgi:hypothetical protein
VLSLCTEKLFLEERMYIFDNLRKLRISDRMPFSHYEQNVHFLYLRCLSDKYFPDCGVCIINGIL